jgi:hypothetical protein
MGAADMSRKNRYKRQPLPPMVKPEPVAFAVQAGEPEWMPTNGMSRLVAQARREMGEEVWFKLNQEWL